MTSLRALGLWGLTAVLAVYAAIVLLLGSCQRRMIYLPRRASESALIDSARHVGLEPWRAGGGNGALLGFRSVAGEKYPWNRIVVFHGNAGYALDRTYFARGFGALEGGTLWEVHLFEYPGYGARPGSPGEKALVRAAGEALEDLRRGDDRPVFLLGESIGSGVACALAAERPHEIAGLVLVTPFTSLPDVAAFHYPFLPVRLLLRDRYDNVGSLERYRGPVAFLAAGRDEIIPPGEVEKLHDGYSGPKSSWVQPGAGHNSLDYATAASFWREVSDFLLREGRP